MFVAVFELPAFIAWEPFFGDIFVCASGIPDSIKILKLWASFPDHSLSSCPKIKKLK